MDLDATTSATVSWFQVETIGALDQHFFTLNEAEAWEVARRWLRDTQCGVCVRLFRDAALRRSWQLNPAPTRTPQNGVEID